MRKAGIRRRSGGCGPAAGDHRHFRDKAKRFLLVLASSSLLATFQSQNPASAETFNNALRGKLKSVCEAPDFGSARGALRGICGGVIVDEEDKVGPVGSVFTATGASPEGAGAPGALEQRLQSRRTSSKEEQLNNELRGAYATRSGDRLAQSDVLQLPPAEGATPQIVFGQGSRAGAFISAGASRVKHGNSRFEDGYDAELPTVTAGADYQVNRWLIAGLALNYTYYDGTYDDGGGFSKHIFGPLLYATITPFRGAFANVAVGYAREDNSNNRFAFVTEDGAPEERFGGHTSADYSQNQYLAAVLAGYDHPVGRVSIGPRLGVAVSYEDYDTIKEEGDTGLELKYSNLDQTSVQSSLGAQASIGLETGFGLLVPQATVAWVHEYANSSRNIDARLLDAPEAGEFTFNREPPARNWAVIGAAVSAILPSGLQPFVAFSTIQGNENYVSYGGSAGLRVGL